MTASNTAADMMTTAPHPAKFNDAILEVVCDVLAARVVDPRDTFELGASILDPFAGIGGIHDLSRDFHTYAVELEPEWAAQAAERGTTFCGDFFDLRWGDDWPTGWPAKFDAVVTSPTYGNRMADSHTPGPNDTSTRMTYRHRLGRPLTGNNSGGMQWGDEYRAFHLAAWMRMRMLLRRGGLLVVNLKDHVRRGQVQPVVAWHDATITRLGFRVVESREVPVSGMGFGQHQEKGNAAKVDREVVLCYRWPGRRKS